MATHYVTRAFVFKKEDRQDSDRMFSVFTEQFGRVEIFAKAIRRIASKLKGGIDAFTLSEISFIEGRNHKTLTDAVVLQKFGHIPESPEKMEVSYLVSQLMDHLLQGQEPDKHIWEITLDFFEKLDSCELPRYFRLVYYYFFWNFISVLGYKPQLRVCSHCGGALNPTSLYFSMGEGGLVCQTCVRQARDKVSINADTVKILRLFAEQQWDTILKLKSHPRSFATLEGVSNMYYNYISHSPRAHE